jgi:acyl-CoA hydrolase
MNINSKKASSSYSVMTEMVLPNDTNTLNHLMGGRMLHWIDIAGAIAAQKHSGRVVVTASVDNVSFKKPIKLGNIITLEAKVTRAFNTSMEVHIQVTAEDIPNNTRVKTHDAFYTYVAIDDNNKPVRVPILEPETEIEKRMYEEAARRRELRLILAGKLKPENSPELINLFLKSLGNH